MEVFLCPIPSCTLSKIAWNRDRCSSHLLCQSIALLCREVSSHLIHGFGQLHRTLPSIKPFVRLTHLHLHFQLPTPHFLLPLPQYLLKDVPDTALPVGQFQTKRT